MGLLVAGAMPWMAWIHWVQLVGTTAMIAVGYCPLARMLSLLPLNRAEPLTRSLAWRVFVQDRCAGGLVQWTTDTLHPAGACCSLRTQAAPVPYLPGQTSPTLVGGPRPVCPSDLPATEPFGTLARIRSEC
jgi:hypothetical protein